jgi:hypothetical protein
MARRDKAAATEEDVPVATALDGEDIASSQPTDSGSADGSGSTTPTVQTGTVASADGTPITWRSVDGVLTTATEMDANGTVLRVDVDSVGPDVAIATGSGDPSVTGTMKFTATPDAPGQTTVLISTGAGMKVSVKDPIPSPTLGIVSLFIMGPAGVTIVFDCTTFFADGQAQVSVYGEFGDGDITVLVPPTALALASLSAETNGTDNGNGDAEPFSFSVDDYLPGLSDLTSWADPVFELFSAPAAPPEVGPPPPSSSTPVPAPTSPAPGVGSPARRQITATRDVASRILDLKTDGDGAAPVQDPPAVDPVTSAPFPFAPPYWPVMGDPRAISSFDDFVSITVWEAVPSWIKKAAVATILEVVTDVLGTDKSTAAKAFYIFIKELLKGAVDKSLDSSWQPPADDGDGPDPEDSSDP